MTTDRMGMAQWEGSLKEGSGTLSTESGVLDQATYSFKTRFEDQKGTNPEELIGAAHAGCFSMAFVAILEKAGYKPNRVQTNATVSIDKTAQGLEISKIHLKLTASIPDIDETTFQEQAKLAKENCLVSKILKTHIELDATLA